MRKLPASFTVAALLAISLAACGSDSETSTSKGVTPGSAAPETTEVAAAPSAPADIKASGLLGGTATPTIPAGDPGKVSVVVTGPVPTNQNSGFSLPIIIRNNTAKTVGRVEVTGAARDATAKLIASGSSQGFVPVSMKSGEAALGYVYFSSSVPSGVKFDFTVQSSGVETGTLSGASLKVVEANLVGKTIVGTATNSTGKPLDGPLGVNLSCFDRSGALIGTSISFARPDKVEANGTATFQIDLFNQPCPTFLVGVRGYYR